MNESRLFEIAKSAFFKGEFETANELFELLYSENVAIKQLSLYRTFSKISHKNISEINMKQLETAIMDEIDYIGHEKKDMDDVITQFLETYVFCQTLCGQLKETYEKEKAELSLLIESAKLAQNDTTSALVSKLKLSEYQNRLSKLDDQMNSAKKLLLETSFLAFLSSKTMVENKAIISLKSLSKLQVSKDSSWTLRDAVKSYTEEVKKARNSAYWDNNQSLRQSLEKEEKELSEKIEKIINEELKTNQLVAKDLEAQLEEVRRQRSQFSIFKIAERAPYNKTIDELKSKLNPINSKIYDLKKGVSETCKDDIKRRDEIVAVLNDQY